MSNLLERMRSNPRGDWSISDVQRVCAEFGLYCSAPKRGSHYKISRHGYPLILTIPFKRPIKPVYIRELIRLIDGAESGR